jgi:hypothetical protein
MCPARYYADSNNGRCQAGLATDVASREDLVLAKLLCGRESRSEGQLRDVRSLLGAELDTQYVEEWVTRLGGRGRWRRAPWSHDTAPPEFR